MNFEIVEDLGNCRSVVAKLMQQEVLSVDAEGVNLGKDGPLTLLQVGTRDGMVYLFDIEREKRMFSDGGLKKLLESNEILKVFHSCNQDSLALNSQFDVLIQNVFDTQIAHMVLMEKSGRLMPPLLKLSEICEIYSSTRLDKKEDIQKSWNKSVANYWEIRPMTPEMIEYACSDVLVLVPEIYENQLRMLQENNAMPLFHERVHEKIHYLLSDAKKQERNDRIVKDAKVVLTKIAQQYPTSVSYELIEDEDFKSALERNWTEEDINTYMTSSVTNIFFDRVQHVLNEIRDEMDRDGDDFNPDPKYYYLLNRAKTYARANIKALATTLFQRYEQIVFNDMVKKFDTSTPLYFLREQEKWLLKNIKIKNYLDVRKYNDVLVQLHYKQNENDFREFEKQLITNPSRMKVSPGFYTFLGYQSKGSHLPDFVKSAASDLKQAIDRAGKNPLPPRKPRPTPRYQRNYHDYDDDDDYY